MVYRSHNTFRIACLREIDSCLLPLGVKLTGRGREVAIEYAHSAWLGVGLKNFESVKNVTCQFLHWLTQQRTKGYNIRFTSEGK